MSEELETPSTNRNSRIALILLIVSIILNIIMVLVMRSFGSSMYPFFITLFLWIPIYAITLTLLLRYDRVTSRPLINSPIALVLVMVLTIGIRLIFLGLDELISLDPLWYLDYGSMMTNGGVPYADFYFPYPPLFAYFIYLVSSVLPTIDGFRILASLFDVMVIFVIWKLATKRVGQRWASIAVIAYALLPISVIESGWNGHFEPLVILLTLLSLWFLFEGRSRLSALSLALAVSAKVYPIFLFPIFVVYLKDWRERIEYTVIAAITGIATFLPFFIPMCLRPTSGTVDESPVPTASLFESLFGQFTSIGIIELSSLIVFACVGLSIVIMVGLILKNAPRLNEMVYHGGVRAIGILFIILGSVAALFVVLPISLIPHWRFPIDFGILRGVFAILIGSYIILISLKKWHSDDVEVTTIESLMTLACGSLLLLTAISRTVFYGWYLLWSLPFFLLIKDRRLGLTVILCFLFVFPGYTSEHFMSLGVEEEKIWSEDFTGVEDWNVTIYGTNESLSTGDITAGIEKDDQSGRLWFNTTGADQQALTDIRIGISKEVTISFDSTIELVLKIATEWNPTFGRYADLALSFNGSLQNGDDIGGYIIPPSSIFTNLTYIPWRSALASQFETENISVSLLTFWILPVKSISSEYMIESMFTTRSGIIHPYFLILVPSLFVVNIFVFILLHRELGKKELNMGCIQLPKTMTNLDITSIAI